MSEFVSEKSLTISVAGTVFPALEEDVLTSGKCTSL